MSNLILYINTAQANKIIIGLKIDNDNFLAKKTIKASRNQSEKLLATIDELLENNKKTIKEVKGILVANKGDSFTSLRIGVLTANALAYALNISIIGEHSSVKKNGKYSLVKPIYEREASIGMSKKGKIN